LSKHDWPAEHTVSAVFVQACATPSAHTVQAEHTLSRVPSHPPERNCACPHALQPSHFVLPVAAWNVPGAHSRQVEPPRLYVPTPHGVHVPWVVGEQLPPVAVPAEQVWQDSHSLPPLVDRNLPGAQVVHTVWLMPVEYVPAAQRGQVLSAVAVQLGDVLEGPDGSYLPGKQVVHHWQATPREAGWYLPGSHAVQAYSRVVLA
jgi:hypothetical protein